jgi:hypothetical protein
VRLCPGPGPAIPYRNPNGGSIGVESTHDLGGPFRVLDEFVLSFPERIMVGNQIRHPGMLGNPKAVAMDRAGVAILDGAALLGHTPDVYVSTYLRKSEKGARSAASALGAALAGGI